MEAITDNVRVSTVMETLVISTREENELIGVYSAETGFRKVISRKLSKGELNDIETTIKQYENEKVRN